MALLIFPQLLRTLLIEQVLAQISRIKQLFFKFVHGLEFIVDLSYGTQISITGVVLELWMLVLYAHVLNFSFTQVDSFLGTQCLACLVPMHKVCADAYLRRDRGLQKIGP